MSRASPEGHSTIARHKLILYANTTGEENVGPIADNVNLNFHYLQYFAFPLNNERDS